MKKLLLIIFLFFAVSGIAQTITPVLYPLYMQGHGTSTASDERRVPYACRMTVSGLTPNTTYYYFNRWAPDPGVQVEQGGIVFVEQIGNWRRSTAPSLGSAANRDTLITDATGSYTGWFVSESNIATDFTPGTQLFFRLVLDVPGGTNPIRVTATESVTVLAWEDYFDPAPTAIGTGVRSANANTAWSPRNFIMLYDNTGGTGRPIAGTYVESDGVANTTANGYVNWYASTTTGVNNFNNRWGTIIPNALPNGIQRIAQYGLTNGGLVNSCTDADGDWGGANGNTVNPSGGGANDPSVVRVIDCTPTGGPVCNLSLSTTQTNVLCFGGNTGAVNLAVTGAGGPVSFSWSNGATTEDLSNVIAGTYTVTVTETGNPSCTATASVTITQPASALSATASSTPTSSIGATNGTVSVTANGGTPPYTYLWAPGGQTTATATGLAMGSYTVTVTDANGCSTTASTQVTTSGPVPAITPVLYPLYMQGHGTSTASDERRVPYACRMTISNLSPNTTYFYYNRWAPDASIQVEQGGIIFAEQIGNWRRSTAPSLGSAANRDTLVTDATGSYTGWFVSESNIATDFTPGTQLFFRLVLDVPGGTNPLRVTASQSVTVLAWEDYFDPAPTAVGTGVRSANANAAWLAKNFVMLFDNTAGSGRPIAGTYVESDGVANTTANGYVGWYAATTTGVNGVNNRWGTILPNNLPNGIQRIAQYALTNGSLVNNCTDTDGDWGGANGNTVNPSGGGANDPSVVRVIDCVPAGLCNLGLSSTQTNVLCFGASTGAINLTVTGAGGPVTFSWNNGATTEDLSGLAAGTYTVTVTETNNPTCTATATVTITQPASALSASATAGTIACFGGSTNVTVTATGGTAPYTGTGTFSRTAGTYTFTVTDANGCTDIETITVTQPTELVAAESHTAVNCFGGSSTVTISATGGTAPYTGTGTFTRTAGTYSFTVTDSRGCTDIVSVTVTQPTELVASESHTAIACFGGSSTVTVSATGGTAPYTGTGTFSRAAGTHTFTVTDANGCTDIINAIITQPTQLTAGSTAPPIATVGGTTTVTVTATGGTAPYTGTGTFTRSAGTYTFTVTDANGCTATTTITLAEPGCNISLSTAVTNVNCFGGSTGAVNLTVTGTSGAITYNWNNGATTQDLSNIPAGTYTVTVTDATNCSATTTVTVTQPTSALSASATAGTIACFGGSANVTVTATGGTAPYTGTGTFSRTAGTYTFTVTDANGCTDIETITIAQPTELAATETHTAIACFGGSSTVTISATGGTAPYTGTGTFTRAAGTHSFTVTDSRGCTDILSVTISQPTQLTAGSTAPPITTVGGTTTVTVTATGGTAPYTGTGTFTRGAGTYTFTVTDANGCTATTTITLAEPGCNISLSTAVTNVGCFGGNTGAINLTVTGATAPVTYNWSNGATTEDISGLAAGNYTVTVTDASGCAASATATVAQPTELIATGTPTSIACFGGSSIVTISASGGTAPYTGTGTFTRTAGTYNFTVTDSRGCTDIVNVTITQPTQLQASASASPITTPGGTTTVVVTAAGGTAPYTGTGNFSRGAGTYNFIVTDANGCADTVGITLTEPGCSIAISTTATNITCFGSTNGAIDLTVTGGVTPIVYSWSNGATSQDITGLAAGNYIVVVTDSTGCSVRDTVTITEPAQLIASASAPPITTVGGSTTVTVTAAGGTAPYSGTGDFTRTAGTYAFYVSDANGCIDSAVITLTEEPGCNISLIAVATNVACFGGSTGAINLTASGATAPVTYSWSNGATTEDISGLPMGTYTVTVTDANDCSATATVTITQPEQLVAASSAAPITTPGGTTTVNVTATGGTAPYTGTGNFTRSAGTYTFTVTDANGCTDTTAITLTEQSGCNITLTTAVKNVKCYGSNTGSIDLTVAGATAPITYSWSNGATTQDLNNITAGTYTVTVTDLRGCTATKTVTVTQPTELAVSASAGIIPCNGTTTTVTVIATGGTAPYSGTGTFTRTAGTYSFTVKDAKGCTKTVTITIAQPTSCPVVCTRTSTITQDFVKKQIRKDDYIWFNSVLDLEEKCGNAPVVINVTNAKIKYKKNNNWITLNVPDARVTLANNIHTSTTSFVNGKWETKAPLRTYGRDVFVAGLSYKVPSNIPGGIDDVKWTADISINREGVEIKWKWAAAVYSYFTTNHSSINVKPIDGYYQNSWCNSNEAGTPENFRRWVEAGGTGWGGRNYTGDFSNGKKVKCGKCNECENDDEREHHDAIADKPVTGDPKNAPVAKLDVAASPNPSAAQFNLDIKSNDAKTPVSIKILDANGLVLEVHQKVAANSIFKVGKPGWTAGIYFAEIIQGEQRTVIRLVKSN